VTGRDVVVGVDVATAHVRAVAADGDGGRLAEATAALPSPVIPRPGRAEQDAGAWWPALVRVLRELTATLGDRARIVVALAVCGTSGTVVALDGGGRPLGPALLYSDQRAVDEAAVAQAAGEERWRRLGLRIQPTFGLPKLAWLVRVYPHARRLAHVPDVLVERLTGHTPPTDWSHALKSGYDPDRHEWAAEALAALGLRRELLPDVLAPTASAGLVTEVASHATGLPAGCEVRLGMTDACAAQLAAGVAEPGQFVSVLGSTLAIKGVSQDLVVDPAGVVYSHRHPDGWWMPGGASNVGARILTEAFAGRDLTELDGRAARHGPASAVTYPLLGRGERFPFSVPAAEGFWLGEPADEVERYRAILEGVAFVERLAFERLASLGLASPSPVTVAGGGSCSTAWNRIRATALGQAVVAKPAATTALGACILAASGTLHPDVAAATRSMSAPGDDVQPEHDAAREALDRNYERLVAALHDRGWLEVARW
jgi:sugar (pentulose or hexulose) kinase